MRVGSLGLHVRQIDDSAVIRNKSSSQGQKGVFHPKALGAGLLKHKQHALVRRHFATKHQTNATLLRGLGDLGVNLVHAQLQLDAGQLGLRLVLGPNKCAPKQDKSGKKKAFHGLTVKQTRRALNGFAHLANPNP